MLKNVILQNKNIKKHKVQIRKVKKLKPVKLRS